MKTVQELLDAKDRQINVLSMVLEGFMSGLIRPKEEFECLSLAKYVETPGGTMTQLKLYLPHEYAGRRFRITVIKE